MTTIGTVIADKYEILKEIGHGGMSTVYLAMDKRLNKQWAVKEIRKQGKDVNDEVCVNSLLAEANLMKQLDHPALPRIVDIIDNGVTMYVVMDYIEGESLDKVLQEYGPQPEEMVIDWASQLCDALGYLHTRKPPIIYRDMKPANVMLKPEGNIKIIDFGIAREYKPQNLSDTTTLGTPGYAPPEQYNGQTSPRSDIYALGMTMHHLLTGVDPRNRGPYVPVRRVNPSLSEGIEAIIDKCVQPAEENRYQSCEELLYDLSDPSRITRDHKRKQKRKLAAFLVAAVMSVVLAIAGFFCSRAAVRINNSNYEALISISATTDYEQKIQSYKDAIAIYPYDTRAYLRLLEAYEDNEQFTKKESDEFLALYNANKTGFDASGAAAAELHYQAGLMYFNYFRDADGTVHFADCVQRAYPFFAENHENDLLTEDYEHENLSDCYYQICSFYKKYILSSATVEEASRQDFVELLETLDATMTRLQNEGAYDQLSLYNGVFMLLYDQRNSMASVNVNENTVLELLKRSYDEACALTVQKEQSKELRQQIISSYQTFYDAIQWAYDQKEET
ncbi:MAG: serine/threonine-protein kinase [Roseburia sp.]|nr:serine/threonine-protein kinase [Roseburia sp.]